MTEPRTTELWTLAATDGATLEAEYAPANAPRANLVLCHPHPQHGGTMRSLVISELFTALPAAGISVLRFNFRGVGASTGTYDHGDAERLDVRGALDAVRDPGLPTLLAGWSFGADLALSVTDPEIAAWIAIASPLRYARDLERVASDPRPKLLALAEHDEFRPVSEVVAEVVGWVACETVVIGGASHFFIGRTEALATAVIGWVTDRF